MMRLGRATGRAIVLCLATGTFGLGCFTLVSANAAFNEAGRWFARATYLNQCTDTASQVPGCLALAQDPPHWPAGIEVTSVDVVLAEGSAIHNTGSSILSLGGMLIAIAAVLVSAAPRKVTLAQKSVAFHPRSRVAALTPGERRPQRSAPPQRA